MQILTSIEFLNCWYNCLIFRTLAIRSDPLGGIKVLVKGCKNPHSAEQKSNVVTDPKWDSIMTDFREVDLARIPGKNFVNKMEMLMAVLAS